MPALVNGVLDGPEAPDVEVVELVYEGILVGRDADGNEVGAVIPAVLSTLVELAYPLLAEIVEFQLGYGTVKVVAVGIV